MSDFTPTGRLAQWDGAAPDLRAWSDAELLEGLAQVGVTTDRVRFGLDACAAEAQAELEEAWLTTVPAAVSSDENLSSFVWMSVQELWERWEVPAWPRDRLSRMFAYLVDNDVAIDWADRFHAPTANAVMDALEAYLYRPDTGLPAFERMVEELGMPRQAWPSKMLDAMAEWSEIGNLTLAQRGGEFLARMLGSGNGLAFLATALISARMMDRAQAAALEVPLDAPIDKGFDETVGYLCLSAGDAMLGDHWIKKADKASGLRKSEMTAAAEAVRQFLTERNGDDSVAVPEAVRKAAKAGASQAAYYAIMAFAGSGTPGGM
ncbi:MAG: hypothetical protein EXR79_04125 [Myxococcales bacterium]|nr:hypothetical protein [Myxococcales bacterium]